MSTDNPLPPVYNENSKILILGSMPSVKSREAGFYYMHPQNRFWKVLEIVFGCKIPSDIQGKKAFLLDSGIALSDVIDSCEIEGSSDSSIDEVVTRDPSEIVRLCNIKRIFLNGRTAQKLYEKHLKDKIGVCAVYLPSTSPANAAFSLEQIAEIWKRNILSEFNT